MIVVTFMLLVACGQLVRAECPIHDQSYLQVDATLSPGALLSLKPLLSCYRYLYNMLLITQNFTIWHVKATRNMGIDIFQNFKKLQFNIHTQVHTIV